MTSKSWIEKLNAEKQLQNKTIEKAFADMPAGTVMHISTPMHIKEYIEQIPPGSKVDIKTLRKDLAIENNADNTCPVTTGIFLRIVTEAANEARSNGKPLEEITPFWRLVDKSMGLYKKLTFDADTYLERLEAEKNNN